MLQTEHASWRGQLGSPGQWWRIGVVSREKARAVRFGELFIEAVRPLEGLEHILSILHIDTNRQIPRNYEALRSAADRIRRPKTASWKWNAGKKRAETPRCGGAGQLMPETNAATTESALWITLQFWAVCSRCRDRKRRVPKRRSTHQNAISDRSRGLWVSSGRSAGGSSPLRPRASGCTSRGRSGHQRARPRVREPSSASRC